MQMKKAFGTQLLRLMRLWYSVRCTQQIFRMTLEMGYARQRNKLLFLWPGRGRVCAIARLYSKSIALLILRNQYNTGRQTVRSLFGEVNHKTISYRAQYREDYDGWIPRSSNIVIIVRNCEKFGHFHQKTAQFHESSAEGRLYCISLANKATSSM